MFVRRGDSGDKLMQEEAEEEEEMQRNSRRDV